MLKRLFDIGVSFMALVLLSPLLLAIAIWIKMNSSGPIFYRGVRVGRYGIPFRIYKFRTMVVNAEKVGGPSTPEDDPRITRVGGFLRKYKLDELPQLINVLIGQMSLVGPRPEVQQEVALYTEEEKALLNVRPGITDYASIKFHNEGEILQGSEDPHQAYREKIRPEKISLGLKYVRNHSLWADIKILADTFRTVLESRVRENPSESRVAGKKSLHN